MKKKKDEEGVIVLQQWICADEIDETGQLNASFKGAESTRRGLSIPIDVLPHP